MSTLPKSFAKLSEEWRIPTAGVQYYESRNEIKKQCADELDALIVEWAAHTIECFIEPVAEVLNIAKLPMLKHDLLGAEGEKSAKGC